MSYWLMKSEATSYSIDDLKDQRVTSWEGVRNFQARNNLMAMKVADIGFFYHSNAKPSGIAGVCRVVREAYPDHTAWDPASRYFDERSSPGKPRWWMVDVEFVEKLPELIALGTLKQISGLAEMVLLRRPRLSVQPVREREWHIIAGLGGMSEGWS